MNVLKKKGEQTSICNSKSIHAKKVNIIKMHSFYQNKLNRELEGNNTHCKINSSVKS